MDNNNNNKRSEAVEIINATSNAAARLDEKRIEAVMTLVKTLGDMFTTAFPIIVKMKQEERNTRYEHEVRMQEARHAHELQIQQNELQIQQIKLHTAQAASGRGLSDKSEEYVSTGYTNGGAKSSSKRI